MGLAAKKWKIPRGISIIKSSLALVDSNYSLELNSTHKLQHVTVLWPLEDHLECLRKKYSCGATGARGVYGNIIVVFIES